MPDLSYALFDTAIGFCAIVWSECGVAGVQLPETDARATRIRVLKRFPAALESEPPPDVQGAIGGIVALLDGQPTDLTEIAIDDAATPDFNRKVYAIARTIPPGATMTYGELAERLATACWRARSALHSGKTLARSSCLATACWPRAARPVASRPAVAWSQSSSC